MRGGRRSLAAGRVCVCGAAARRPVGRSVGPAGRAGGREVYSRRPLPGQSAQGCCEAGGSGAAGVGVRGAEGRAAGDGVAPAAGGRGPGPGWRGRRAGMSPHRASLARRSRRRQHRRRHLHFCPSFSASQARLPGGGGGANGGRRRRREETGGRGVGLRGAGLRETGAEALAIGRLNDVAPRRCKARADWSVRPRALRPAPSVGGGPARVSVPGARVLE